uniref:PRONE domain-containing protein n=1 Tax=Setaria viridis TaxID=4556 RepID=A0A4U6SZE5_SETVI|nr:hypothetical protein SEVIR_9G190300v2 [Setaria viridis]
MSFPGKFSPEYLLDCLEISSKHEALEAAMHVWRRKASQSHSRSPWSAVKDLVESDKNVMLASCAKDTTLDASKIQYNKVSEQLQLKHEHLNAAAASASGSFYALLADIHFALFSLLAVL